MELIFGFLPPPIALVALGAITVATLIIRKKWPKSKAAEIANSTVDSVVTKDRVDKAVEAVLARLRVNPILADKIGDLIAEIISAIITIDKPKRSIGTTTVLTAEITNDPEVRNAAVKVLADDNTIGELITEVAGLDVTMDVTARRMIASEVFAHYVTTAHADKEM